MYVGYLEPGRITPAAENAFLHGACGALALAIHETLGWDIIAVTDAHNVFEGKAGGGSALHWMNRCPDNGRLVDILGAHTDEAILDEYVDEADDEECAIGLSAAEDCREWYIEAQGEPVSVAFAKTFVEAVVARARAKPPGISPSPDMV